MWTSYLDGPQEDQGRWAEGVAADEPGAGRGHGEVRVEGERGWNSAGLQGPRRYERVWVAALHPLFM